MLYRCRVFQAGYLTPRVDFWSVVISLLINYCNVPFDRFTYPRVEYRRGLVRRRHLRHRLFLLLKRYRRSPEQGKEGSMFPAASNRSPCMYHALQFFFFRVHPVVFRRGITYRVRAGASRVPPAVFLKFQISIIGSTPMHVLVMPNGLIGPIGLDVNGNWGFVLLRNTCRSSACRAMACSPNSWSMPNPTL